METEKNINRKLKGYDFFNKILKKPKFVLAPMVEHSEHAWRILTRRYGADLCFTPMFHAKLFSDPKNNTYRKEQWDTDKFDRPLIAQFCANDPQILLNAAKMIEDECDAIDINLGCPQHIARRGHYGSFLMEEWDLIESMVKILHENLKIPVTCKIRVFPEIEKTLKYVNMLVNAGCQMLTVHARFREQKGHNTGLADWKYIKIIKENVNIPVIANGNILYHEDIQRCIDETGADAVMSGETLLYNPGLFKPGYLPVWHYAEEYLNIYKERPASTTLGSVRAHLFKLLNPCLHIHTDLRARLAKATKIDEMFKIVTEIKERLIKTAEENPIDDPNFDKRDEKGHRIIPHWLVQPYIRKELIPNKRKMEQQKQENNKKEKSQVELDISSSKVNTTINNNEKEKNQCTTKENSIIDKEIKEKSEDININVNVNNKKRDLTSTSIDNDAKIAKVEKGKKVRRKQPRIRCQNCNNIASDTCLFKMCKLCCRNKTNSMENSEICETHKPSSRK